MCVFALHVTDGPGRSLSTVRSCAIRRVRRTRAARQCKCVRTMALSCVCVALVGCLLACARVTMRTCVCTPAHWLGGARARARARLCPFVCVRVCVCAVHVADGNGLWPSIAHSWYRVSNARGARVQVFLRWPRGMPRLARPAHHTG